MECICFFELSISQKVRDQNRGSRENCQSYSPQLLQETEGSVPLFHIMKADRSLIHYSEEVIILHYFAEIPPLILVQVAYSLESNVNNGPVHTMKELSILNLELFSWRSSLLEEHLCVQISSQQNNYSSWFNANHVSEHKNEHWSRSTVYLTQFSMCLEWQEEI